MAEKAAYLLSLWRSRSLALQFIVVAAGVLAVTMSVLGLWVSATIEAGVVRHAAASTALYMDSFIEPLVQDLATQRRISPQAQRDVQYLLETPLGRQVLAVKIWNPDGSIAFSSDRSLIGKRFPVSEELDSALNGSVEAEFDSLNDEENINERELGHSVLEIYAPVREIGSGRIIGVAEFYEYADQLKADLAAARRLSWMVVGSLTVVMIVLLFSIVKRGSDTISCQQASLSDQVDQLSAALNQNRVLRDRVAQANQRAAEANELFLRRVGADLHDGPAQLIGLSLLRLDALEVVVEQDPAGSRETQIIRHALADAMQDIRNVSAGLALPELEDMDVAQVIDLVIHNHETRTGSKVSKIIETLPAVQALPIKTCIYRFVQEALNNAYKHAAGVGQAVSARVVDGRLEIAVADGGPGGVEVKSASKHGSLGLKGLRDRIESLGGQFEVTSPSGEGTRLALRFRLDEAFRATELAEALA